MYQLCPVYLVYYVLYLDTYVVYLVYLDNLNKIYLRLNTDREKYYRVKSAEVSLTKHPRHFSTMELSLNTFIYIYIVHGIYNIQYLLIGTNE